MAVTLIPIRYNILERNVTTLPFPEINTNTAIEPITHEAPEELSTPVVYDEEPIVLLEEDLRSIPIELIFERAGITHINGKLIKFGSPEVRTPDSPYYKKNSGHSHTDETGTAAARDISIVGGTIEDYTALQLAMLNSPLVLEYFRQKSWGVINEITNLILEKTGGSGSHFHLGTGTWAVRTWNTWNADPNTPVTLYISAKNGTKLIPKGLNSLELIPVVDPLNEGLDKMEQRAIRRATTPQVVPVPTLSVPTMRAGDYANMSGPDNYAFNSDAAALQESRRIAAQNAMVEALYEANTVPVKVATAGGGTTTVRVPKEWGHAEGELVTDPKVTAIAQGEQPERYADPINNALNWGIFTALTSGAAASNGAFSNTINGATNFTRALTNPATLTHLITRPLLAGTIGYETANLGSELLTGQTVDLHISDDLQGIFNFSELKANIIAPFLNPGGWLSGGKYMGPLLGIADTPLQQSINNIVLRTLPPSFLDRHVATIQKVLNPWLTSKKKVNTALNINDGVITLGDAKWETPFKSLSTPFLLKYFKPVQSARQYYRTDTPYLDYGTAIPAATDLLLHDPENRPDWLIGLEYGLLGRGLLNRAVTNKALRWDFNYLLDHKNLSNYLNRVGGSMRTANIYSPGFYDLVLPYRKVNMEILPFGNAINFLDKHPKLRYKIDPDSRTLLYTDYNGNTFLVGSYDGSGKFILGPSPTDPAYSVNKNINLINYNTGVPYTGQIHMSPEGALVPQEYLNILRGNVDYVTNTLFPGTRLKLYGSAAGVLDAGLPHATHDIDFYITLKEFDALNRSGKLSGKRGAKSNENTFVYVINKDWDDLGNIDLNIIREGKDGYATGFRAEELFRQYFPDDYSKAIRESWASGNPIKINKTPEELFDAIHPAQKSIMDSWEIDYTRNNKYKHRLRPLTYSLFADPLLVSTGISQYGRSLLGSRFDGLPMQPSMLTDIEANKRILSRIGISEKLPDWAVDRIASDPNRMLNTLNTWYITDFTPMRAIKGTWPEVKGKTPENYVRSATTWIPENNNGNALGEGLNFTIGGHSGYPGPQAYIKPLFNPTASTAEGIIDELYRAYGMGSEAPALLAASPIGKNAVPYLLDLYKTHGYNFLNNGLRFGDGRYVSGTRTFNPYVDYVGFLPENYRLISSDQRFTMPEVDHVIPIGNKSRIRKVPHSPFSIAGSPYYFYLDDFAYAGPWVIYPSVVGLGMSLPIGLINVAEYYDPLKGFSLK